MTRSLPRVAILGGGPIGLDAALAAAQAGLPFTVYEAEGHVGADVLDWGHVQMFSPWSLNLSDRMIARLGPPKDPTVCPTGEEFAREALHPLATLPELRDHIRTGLRVVAVSRDGLLKGEEIGTGARADHPFRILLRDAAGHEFVAGADVVLDCTGSRAVPNSLGDGGIPAPGERSLEDRLDRSMPDLATERADWEGKSVLIVGAGYSAQTAAGTLGTLARADGGTSVRWAIRGDRSEIAPIPNDSLPARAALSAQALELTTPNGDAAVELITDSCVQGLRPSGPGFDVSLRVGDDPERVVYADRVLALTGSTGDRSIYSALQVHECYATSGLMNLSAALLGETSADCLDQTTHGLDTLRSPEPNFYILGSKSYGSNSTFLLRIGYGQVSEVFDGLSRL